MESPPDSSTASRSRELLLWLAAMGGYGALLAMAEPHVFDDAYMFLRYADNIIAGHGYTWNAGDPPTYGCTSIAFTYAVSVARWLFPSAHETALATGLGSFLGLVAVASTGLLLRSQRRGWVTGALFLLFAWNPKTVYHSLTGMETMLSFSSLCLLAWASLRWASRGGAAWAAVPALAGYSAFLVRPDNGIYSALLPLLCVFLLGPKDRRRPWREGLSFCGIFGLLLLLDGLVKTHFFGHPLPLPHFAKGPSFNDGYQGMYLWNPVLYLWHFLLVFSPAFAWIALAPKRSDLCRIAAFGLPVLLTFAYYFTVIQIMGGSARYYFPTSALVLALGAGLDGRPLDLLKHRWKRMAALAVAACLLLAARGPLASAYLRSHSSPDQLLGVEGAPDAESPLRLKWRDSMDGMVRIVRTLPPGTVMAASEHGELAAARSDIAILDTLGLHDPETAMEGFSAARLTARRPGLIWLPHFHYSPAVRQLLEDPVFRRDYIYVPDAYRYGVAVHRSEEKLQALLRSAFESDYPDADWEQSVHHFN
jgi:hypothetical protein